MSKLRLAFVVMSVLTATCTGTRAQVPATQPSPPPNIPTPQAVEKAPIVRQARPTTGPSSRPANPSAAALPKEFAIFEKQNPFAHGPPPQLASAQMGPESNLVLKGVMDTSGTCVAFIEDTASKHVMQVSSGQPVGRGRLKMVSLDAVEYEAMGNAKKIMVGQNFNGQVVPPTPATQPAGPQPPPGAPGPGQGPPPGPGGPQPMPGRPGPARVVTAPK